MDRLAVEGAKTIRAGESVVVREPMDRLDQAFTDLAQYSWVIFTSRNAVKIFFERMHEKHVDLRKLGSLKFAAVARGTGEYLENIGITHDYIQKEYTTKALEDGLAANLKEAGEISGISESGKLLIPRAKQGSKILTDRLEEQGYLFDDIPIYDVRAEQTDLSLLKHADYITIDSGYGVR